MKKNLCRDFLTDLRIVTPPTNTKKRFLEFRLSVNYVCIYVTVCFTADQKVGRIAFIRVGLYFSVYSRYHAVIAS
jgi:hypothetical protein